MSVVNIASALQGEVGSPPIRGVVNGGEPAPARGGGSAPSSGEAGAVQAMGRSEVEDVVAELQQNLEFINTKIAFRVDDKSKEVVVEVMDKETGRVLKQIPPAELLKIRSAFKDLVRGALVNAEA